MKVISFYHDIDDSGYFEAHAIRLKDQCEALYLDHIIFEEDFGDRWIDNVKAKPTFLLKTLKSLEEPFLWVDVDCEILSNPFDMDFDWDFASPGTNIRDAHDCVHFVGDTEETKTFLLEWERVCNLRTCQGSHSALRGVLTDQEFMEEINYGYLPMTYVDGPIIKIGISEGIEKDY